MTEPPLRHRRKAPALGNLAAVAVTLCVLVPCLYYPYASQVPHPGFELIPATWEVFGVQPCPRGSDCLQLGDRVLAIDDLTFEGYRSDRTLDLLAPFADDGKAMVRLLRDGRPRTLEVRLRETGAAAVTLAFLLALLPLVFWLMGTALVILLRPHDERWLVLVLFSYTTAVLLASGLASARHAGGAAVVFHAVVWLFLPLAVHLHLLLPSPLLGRWRRPLLALLYTASLACAALDATRRLEPEYLHVLSFVAGVALALLLLALRLVLPAAPGVRIANRIMTFGVVVGFAPVLSLFLALPLLVARGGPLASRGELLEPWLLGLTSLAVPLLPLSYLYAIYRHSFAALEFRANRLLGTCGFFAVWAPLYLLLLAQPARRWGMHDGRLLSAMLLVSLLMVAVAPALRRGFQTLVDRHVFGIRHTPKEVVELVSARIPGVFDRATLARVIVDEILPALLIRRSALYLFSGDEAETLYEQDLPPAEAAPDAAALRPLLAHAGACPPPAPDLPAPRFGWVRLVLPLAVQGEAIGVWLIGRRDPDDHFSAGDIQLLSTVGNQLAPVAENIRLFERAQREIAQRKAAEEEIRRSEERFRTLFAATVEGIAIVRQGTILEVNQALPGLLGYDPQELIGHPLAGVLSDPGVEPGAPARQTVARRRDGATVEVEVEAASLSVQGERLTVVAVRDLTQRKRHEAEKKRLERQLLLAQKMEAIGRLSAGVAHDFNNCLVVILGYADLLLDDPALPVEQRPQLTAIQEAGLRAAALTKELLAFARRQTVEPQVVDFNQIVSSLERMLRRLIGDDVALVVELDPLLGLVRIDPGRMEHVLVNLAINARHAMPQGGSLTVRTTALTVRPLTGAPHEGVPPGRWALVTIADTGVGMDAETRARVFEPFFTTRQPGEGTGLGLATAYGFVAQSGGLIFVDSAPGEGARFSIYLPVVERDAAAEAAPAPMLPRGSETVLVVEDEQAVRGVVVMLLRSLGYQVFEAQSPRHALAMAERYGGPLHLLLTDVSMPELGGRELAVRVRARRPSTRVLFMSGQQEEPPANGPASHFLQKPFSSQDLGRAVRATLDAPAA
ncbi:MAG TPA: ATP-binding protein [Thermoanaerobaculia bacterium]|nr:ATP-binding protein [Thermoanaerobaculia bacterium]